MPANLVRIQYEDVEQMAQRVVRESNETEGTMKIIHQGVDILRDGAWGGVAAEAFYAKMDEVFKRLDKLVEALNTAETKVREAAAKFKEMEEQQSNKFKQLESQMQKYVNSK
jgi:WXG100 family type VII secretion target